jgi:hypothetical protein
MRFSMSGLIQYLTWGELRAAMDQGDARAAAPQFEGRDGSGVLAADDGHVHLEIGMGIDVVVVDLAEVLAGNVHVVGQVVVAGGDDELAGVEISPGRPKRSSVCTAKGCRRRR